MATDIADQIKLLQTYVDFEHGEVGLRCDDLSDVVGKNIPADLCNVLRNSESFNSAPVELFLGFDVLRYDVLVDTYSGKEEPNRILQTLGADPDLNMKSGYQFYFIEDEKGFVEEKVDVTALRDMIPIFEFNGEFMFYSFHDNPSLCGLIGVVDGQASVVAPSISTHIADVLGGLTEGTYQVSEGEVIYPSSWHYRQKLRKGLVEIDNYGEIIEP